MASKGRYTVYAELKGGICKGRITKWDGKKTTILDDYELGPDDYNNYRSAYIEVLRRSLDRILTDQEDDRFEGNELVTGLELFSPVKYFERSLTSVDLFTKPSLAQVRDLLTFGVIIDPKNIIFSEGTMDLVNGRVDREVEEYMSLDDMFAAVEEG